MNKEAFKTTLAKVWNPMGWIKFNEVGENIYVLEFENVIDKEKVLQGRPWSLDGNLVSLHSFDGAYHPKSSSSHMNHFGCNSITSYGSNDKGDWGDYRASHWQCSPSEG